MYPAGEPHRGLAVMLDDGLAVMLDECERKESRCACVSGDL
jgi:hypothetical protein